MRSLNDRGFTLLETIIAMAIMTVAFAAILMVESGSIKAAERTKRMNTVAMLARDAMIDAETKFQGKSFDEVKKEDGGDFKEPFQDYKWKTTIKEIEFPNLNLASAAQSASGGGQAGAGSADSGGGDTSDTTALVTKLVTNYLSKAMREVTVTVSWKQGEGEQSFSVTQYWVDLNHEFQLSD